MWAVVGATGTGKTDLALEMGGLLAEGPEPKTLEIVNADAMQLYRELNIGTAKPSPRARAAIAHHQLDVLGVEQDASVAAYQRAARADIAGISSRGHLPVLVGGSGLYVSSVLFDLDFPPANSQVRERIAQEMRLLGLEVMTQRLLECSPELVARMDSLNPRRVIRALEVYELSGRAPRQVMPRAAYAQEVWVWHLVCEADSLRRRLAQRVEGMWRAGLVEEVRALESAGLQLGRTARYAIGYSQAIAQIQGELSEDEAKESTLLATLRLARRQHKWFARYPKLCPLDTTAGYGPALVALKNQFLANYRRSLAGYGGA